VLALGELIGYRGTLPYTLFFAFGMTLLSAVPLVMLIRTWIGFRSIAVAAATVACALWVLAGAADFVLDLSGRSRLHGAPFAAFLLACSTGWLVFQEGYPSRPGWRGRLASLQPGETLSRSVYARLLASESALAARERLVDSGFLALGAAHELKNTLSNIRATALHGLAQEDAGSKDESLRLLLEHAGIGADSATALLSRISSTGREEPVLIDAARDLSGFMRMARAAFRGEGITLQAELQPGTRFHARRSEVEQILMHLIRNAAEAYRKLGTEGRKAIVVTARTVDEFAVLEVQDAAGGIPADAVPRLFSMASSGSGSTGLGLCLSRGLAQENGGSLEYQQNDRGCSFRLVFPSEQGPEA
jgi:signal transduction histidine kinase